MRPAIRSIASLVALAVVPVAVQAQSGQSTARAVAMGRSMTASARGYEAVAWNPALLGMPGSPGFSLSLPQIGINAYSNALGPSDLWHYYRIDTLSTQDKNDILTKIRGTGDSTFGVGILADVMGLGFTFKNFGVSVFGTADGAQATAGPACLCGC